MNAAGSGRTTLVLMNNSTESGGDIDRLINAIAGAPRAAGKKVLITSSEDDLHSTCRSALQGNTKCFGAAVFQSSPSSAGGSWNYTLRADAALGKTVDIGSKTNDVDIYVIPLQHAIDSAIANLNVSGTSVELPARVQDYLFTSQTQEQRKEQETIQLLKTNINFVAVVWYLTLIGLTYQLVGLMAKERETEMSALIESMMPNLRRWEPQAIRLIARHIAFDIVYGPSWILVGLIAKGGLFQKSNTAIPVIGFVLAGLALTSFSLLGASFFKRAQLSSITVLLVAVVLAVATQIRIKSLSTVPVAILSLIFSPVAFVHFFILCSRWEFEKLPIDMTTAPPNTIWHVPGLSFWVFFIVQIVVYPLLAALVERKIHGTTASRKGREVAQRAGSDEPPIIISGFTKIYSQPEFLQRIMRLFRRKPTSVLAVDDLSLSVLKGQITVLVGANGCGKSTTLNAIAGLTGMTSGRISLDGTGGIGLCPQKNVLWNSLTVKQHANIFNRLKAGSKEHVGQDVDQLTKSCGLADKVNSPSRSLSGGQKRKLQLVMMLTGGSRVCCVDEVSGGLDPLSRRRIWDILLAERGVRTVILTTHFLDEAEFLADTMVVMSKGQLKAQGSTSELKSKLGNGYRVQVLTPSHHGAPGGAAISHEKFDQSETTSDPSSALALIKALEKDGITNYQVAGPTIEEVFMKLAADLDAAYDDSSERLQTPSSKAESEDTPETSTHKADTSTITVNTATSDDGLVHQVGAFQQALILFQKRWTVFKRNPWPILLALLLPVIASGLESMLLSNTHNTGCSLSEQVGTSSAQTLSAKTNPLLVVGPKNAISADKLQLFSSGSLAGTVSGKSNTSLLGSVHYVNSLPELFSYTNQHHTNVTPGGLYLGDSSSPPTFNARSNVGTMGIFAAVLVQNILNVLLTNTPITTQYAFFDFPWPADTTDTLQFTFYFGLIMASYPALFALYACQERVRGVRAMEYSNGVRPISLWAAYLLFDWMVVLLVSAAIAIIFATATGPAWYHVGYLFVIMVLYGLASILLSYAISLLAKSHFAAFALAAGGQA
jgi:ABC-type multidrug transport system ATPase subunit